jgi:serine/threonine-protein kinase
MGTASVETMRAAPRVIGDYEVLTTLGHGGMGRVYLARKRIVGNVFREYALKLVHASEDAADFHRVLLEEAKLAARIHHPNVVSVLEVGECEEGVFLVMDYVDGVNLGLLARLCRETGRTMPLRVAARIVHDALAGLHAAHELCDEAGASLSVVHRDFSPQNLMVGTDGATRLTDFGIAKARSRADTTRTGQVKGKIGYMAPEQALGRALDRRADVWAAGVVAWEAISGKRLFQGDTEAETIIRIVSDPEIPALYAERADVPIEVHEAVVSALMTDPVRRCPHAGELRRRLEVAWRAADGIGELDEVAALVREVAAEKLAVRRRRIAEATETVELRDETKNAMAAPPHKASSRRGALATISLLAVAIAGGVAYERGWLDTYLPPRTTAQSALVPELDIKLDIKAPAAGWLTLSANAEIREVWMNGKQLLLSQPSQEVRVELPANAGDTIDVAVVTSDGRRAEQRVSSAAGKASFELPPASASASVAPPPPPPVRRPRDDRLLPYRPGK